MGLWGTEDAGCRVTGPEDWRTGDWGTERTGLEVPEAVILLLFIARGGIPDLPPKFRLHNTFINMYLVMKRTFLFCIFNQIIFVPEGGGGDLFCSFSLSRAKRSACALHCFLNSVKMGYFCVKQVSAY